MGELKDQKTVTRREVLKLAGTAAAFCTSFGFLHGHAEPGQLPSQRLHKNEANAQLQIKWQKAEIKWYAGNTLLHASAIPAKVAKHLGADLNATVEVKLFRSGQMLKNMGTIQAKG
jgi:hypothetical protein